MNLTIKQNNQVTEQVTSELIDKLYNLTKEDVANGITAIATVPSGGLQGRLESASAYGDEVEYLNRVFGPNLYISALKYYVRFEDGNVLDALLGANYGDGIGLSAQEVRAIVFGNLFKNNTLIQSFDEFKEFLTQANSSYSFQGCTNLRSIKIPAGATSIPQEAFRGCTSLQSIEIPSSVVTIGVSAFREDAALSSIVIPNSVITLLGGAFQGCSNLETVDLGNSLETIGSEAFRSCTSLQEIVIPDSVKSMTTAFKLCSLLRTITMGSGIQTLSDENFRYCDALSTVIVKDLDAWTAIDVNSSFATPLNNVSHITYNGAYVTSYNFPSGRTKIGSYCFHRCVDLTSVTVPAGYTEIGKYAFNNCTNLTTLTFADSSDITTIGNYALYNVKLNHSLSFPNVTSVGDGALKHSSAWEYDGSKEITGFNNLTSVGDSSFTYNKNIKTVNITNCTNLNKKSCFAHTIIDKFSGPNSTSGELNLPNVTGTIGEQCFRANSGITKIVSLGTCSEIKAYAFAECKNLTEVDLPSTVTSIGAATFMHDNVPNSSGSNAGHSNITIKLRATNPPSLDNVTQNNLLSIGIGATVYVPQGSLSAYQADSGWAALIAKGVTLIEGIPS